MPPGLDPPARAGSRAVARADPTAELLVAGDPAVLSGAEEGNACSSPLPADCPEGLADRLATTGRSPAAVLTGHRLDARSGAPAEVVLRGGGCRGRVRSRRVAWQPCQTSNDASP